MNQMIYLMWGAKGWIGSILRNILLELNHTVIVAKSRLENYAEINQELIDIKPDFVLHVAGLTGNPTVDSLEQIPQDTYLINAGGTLNLVDACWRNKIHVTYYATGCIYTFDSEHPVGSKFSEMDSPNFKGSTYSRSKILAEQLLAPYSNVLILRIRLPISQDMHPKNIITKLSKYNRVLDIPNSYTVLPELLPISIKMGQDKLTGIYNLTNPGSMTHSQILELYQKYVDPDKTWDLLSPEETESMKAKRSNCILDTSKLEAYGKVNSIMETVELIVKNIK